MAKQPKTYTAPHVVQADGQLYQPGEPFTTAAPKGEKWEQVKGSESAFDRAIDAATDDIPGGVPLEDLELGALQALAAESNIPTKGLSKKQLIAALNARTIPEL